MLSSKNCALAFFSQLKETTEQNEFLALLKEITPFFKEKKFYLFFSLPFILLSQKEQFLSRLIDKKFLFIFLFLLKNRAFLQLPMIFKEYQELVEKRDKILKVTIFVPNNLDLAFLNSLKAKLETTYFRKVKLQSKVDPSLLQGALLIINDQVIDFSIKSILNRLKNQLLALNF